MSVYRPQGSKVFRYDFQRGGDRFSGSTEQTERRKAEEVERAEKRKAEAAIKAGRRKKNTGMSFDAAVGRYNADIGQHTANAEELWANLTRLVEWIGAETPIAEITDATVADLVSRRRAEYRWGRKELGLVSAGQVNRSVTQLLRRVLTKARKRWKQHLPDEPDWAEHMLTETRARTRELTMEEESRIEAVERADYLPARLFAQITGLRKREVVSLTWSQVDFDAEVIRVVGKGTIPHVIPITPELHAILWPLRGQHETSVFTFLCRRTSRRHKHEVGQRYPITYYGFSTYMRRMLVSAGVQGLRIHDLRHTAATRMLRADKNLRVVQRLLNHSTLRVTEKYTHASLDDLRQAMKQTAADERRRRSKSHRNPHKSRTTGEK